LYSGQIQTPLGSMLAITDSQGIYLLEFEDRPELDAEIALICQKTEDRVSGKSCPLVKKLQVELDEYFVNAFYGFTTSWILTGTEFENSVWRLLQTIPIGQTNSYSQLAAKLGKPKATRAVGRANGKNPLAILVPCHRLIGSKGDLTGYGAKNGCLIMNCKRDRIQYEKILIRIKDENFLKLAKIILENQDNATMTGIVELLRYYDIPFTDL
jgi:O-6-methylguanine DNA methyltransferase